MKNTTKLFSLIFLTLTLGLMIASCKKDNNIKPTSLSESIIGTWILNSVTVDGNELIPTLMTSGTLTFNPDSTFVSVTNTFIGVQTTMQTYTVDETTKTLTTTKTNGIVYILSVQLNGNKITLSYTDEDGQFNVFKATKQ